MTLSPKGRFMTSDQAKIHAEIVGQPWLQTSLEIALAEYAMTIPAAPHPSQAADFHNRLVGARDLIHTFLNLSNPFKVTGRSTAQDNLNWNPKPEPPEKTK